MVGRYVVRLNSWKVRKVKCLLHGVESWYYWRISVSFSVVTSP